MTRSLAVDLGGTHVRFRLVEDEEGARRRRASVHVVEACGVASFEAALGQWRERTGEHGRLDAVAVAAAGPVVGDRVRITNLGWILDAREIERSLGAGRCLLVNDVTAVAWALPWLGKDDVRELGAADMEGGVADVGEVPGTGTGDPNGHGKGGVHGSGADAAGVAGGMQGFGTENPDGRATTAIIAPGTGLGISGLVPDGAGGFVAVEGEGGHRTLAAQSPREWAILNVLVERFGHASAERALSGPGIEALYRAIASIDGVSCRGKKTAAEIAHAAFTRSDPTAEESIETFTGFLGSVAGDLALTLGARGGVYVAGGIVPGWGGRFDAARFLDRFRAKGRFRDYLSAVPVRVVTHPYPALAGTEHLLARRLAGASRVSRRCAAG